MAKRCCCFSSCIAVKRSKLLLQNQGADLSSHLVKTPNVFQQNMPISSDGQFPFVVVHYFNFQLSEKAICSKKNTAAQNH